jgi:hypothetical protein
MIILKVAQGTYNRGSTLDIRLSGSTVLSGSPSKDSVETMESADMKYSQVKLKEVLAACMEFDLEIWRELQYSK